MKCVWQFLERSSKPISEHDMLMGKVDFGGVSSASAWNTCPRCESANMSWSTSVSPFRVIDEQEAKYVFAFLER